MTEWSIDAVASRFIEAARTAERLPPVLVEGHFNVWPPFVRTETEALSAEDTPYLHLQPSPAEIERMLVAMHWVQWLELEQRHLVWMRAKRYGWRKIAIRFACDRSTAWRHWHQALHLITWHLNSAVPTGSKPR